MPELVKAEFAHTGIERSDYEFFSTEAFTQGKDKLKPSKSEDLIVKSSNILAVIDGATPKGNLSFKEKSGGQYAAHLVEKALKDKESSNLTGIELVDFVCAYMEDSFRNQGFLEAIEEFPEARPSATFAVAKVLGEKIIITQVGDVGFRINGIALHENPKDIDRINSQKRKEAIEKAKKDNPNLSHDELLLLGRASITGDLEKQVENLQNNPDDPLGYGSLDGRKVPGKFVKVFTYDLKDVAILELFSDGYFKPSEKPRVDSWEESFRDVEEVDSDKIGQYPSTKGTSESSYTDDRSILIARFKENQTDNPYFDVLVEGELGEDDIDIIMEDFEGENVFLDKAENVEGRLRLACHLSDEPKGRMGTNLLIETSDGKLIVMRRPDDAPTKPGALSVMGGYPKPSQDFKDGRWNPFLTVTREMEEEAGIKEDELTKIFARAIILNKTVGNPTFIFEAKTTLSSDEIKDRQKSLTEEETGENKFINIDRAEIEHAILWWAFFPSPSGTAALALYGKKLYGEDWFKRIQTRLTYRNRRLYSNLSKEKKSQLEKRAKERLAKL